VQKTHSESARMAVFGKLASESEISMGFYLKCHIIVL